MLTRCPKCEAEFECDDRIAASHAFTDCEVCGCHFEIRKAFAKRLPPHSALSGATPPSCSSNVPMVWLLIAAGGLCLLTAVAIALLLMVA